MPTGLGAHLVQQLHHPFALHGGPVLDGRPSSDLAVLLLDLGGAPLGDERPQFAAQSQSTRLSFWLRQKRNIRKNQEGKDSARARKPGFVGLISVGGFSQWQQVRLCSQSVIMKQGDMTQQASPLALLRGPH